VMTVITVVNLILPCPFSVMSMKSAMAMHGIPGTEENSHLTQEG
jgi:hypothetical protein